MDAQTSNRSSVDALRTLLRDVSVIQASQYFDGAPVALISAPTEFKLGQVLTRHIAMVLLTSSELRVVFKVHFNPEHIQRYRQSQGHRASELGDKQTVDFMKELTNQMGGRVCRIFDTHQMSMGMSVPLCTRGIYEIYADYQAKTGSVVKFGDFWRLEGPFEFLYCSAYVEIMTKDDLSHIQAADESAQEGELDFL